MHGVDRPEPIPDGSGLLHIGPPKTGTTALQAALHARREELVAHGVDYVSHVANPHGAARYAAGWDGGTRGATYRRRWERLAHAFRTSSARHAVLSAEALSTAGPEGVRAIHEAVGPDAHVLITLRSRAAWLPSAWQQMTRTGNTVPLDEWLQTALAAPRGEGPMRVVDPVRLMETWGSVFGEDRLILLAGGRDRTAVLRVTEALLGLPEMLELQPALNESLGFAEIEVLRHLHLAGGVPAATPEAARRIMAQSVKKLSRVPRDRADRQPIPMPRWAVEAANQADAEDRSVLEASRATVIGDLAELRVDPDGHPDSFEMPSHVDVATAGLIAEIVARTALERSASTQPAPQRAEGRSLQDHTTAELISALGARLRPGRRP